ncbi:hypothetical protein M8C21_016832, partial [Ambrosia artemisiifolia]
AFLFPPLPCIFPENRIIIIMSDQIAKGEDFEKQADKKLRDWKLFGSKHEDAADLYEKAANFYKIGKSSGLFDEIKGNFYSRQTRRFGSVTVGDSRNLDSKHEAANAYADAGSHMKSFGPSPLYFHVNMTDHILLSPFILKKFSHRISGYFALAECISRLEQALDLYMEIGRLSMSARFCKEIAELYEQQQNLEKAMDYYDKAADFYQGEEVSSSANQCRLKIAEYAAEMEQYQKAIEIYEDIARQALSNNLLKYGVKGHLLNAGICQLCKGDDVALTNALEKYQDMDPTFAGTREYRLLADLAASIEEEDVAKFTDAIKEFDSMTKLDAWKTTLLLRVKDLLKAKEMEEDDLT